MRLEYTKARFICVLLLCLLPVIAHADEYTFQFQRIIDIEQPVTLNLGLEVGSVEVNGIEGNQIRIDAVKRIAAANEKDAEAVASYIEIKVDETKKNVAVATNYLRIPYRGQSFWQRLLGWGEDSYGAVDYKISLPIGCSISVTALDAKVFLSGIQGDVNVQLAAGETTGEFIFGPVTVRQPVGNISLDAIEGDIRVRSNKSDVLIGQALGALDITTQTGNIMIKSELVSPRNSYIQTTTGTITFMVPPTASAKFTIETETGEIASELPLAITSLNQNRLVGEINEGGTSVKLHSSTGDVKVRFY